MEVLQLTNAKSTPRWISENLAIPLSKVKICITRLLRTGLIIRDGKKLKRATLHHYNWGENVPSASIKEFHKQVLLRSIQSLYATPFEKRDFRATILSISEDDIPMVEERIQKTTLEINKMLYKSKKKDRVYVYSCQFFPVDAG